VAAALGKALLEVEGNGVGIDQKSLPHIFERQNCAKTLALRQNSIYSDLGISL
jgi:hypothetical protein